MKVLVLEDIIQIIIADCIISIRNDRLDCIDLGEQFVAEYDDDGRINIFDDVYLFNDDGEVRAFIEWITGKIRIDVGTDEPSRRYVVEFFDNFLIVCEMIGGDVNNLNNTVLVNHGQFYRMYPLPAGLLYNLEGRRLSDDYLAMILASKDCSNIEIKRTIARKSAITN